MLLSCFLCYMYRYGDTGTPPVVIVCSYKVRRLKFMVESRCGLVCSECSFRETMGCKGCMEMDKPFWAESCPVKSCCEEKDNMHCGTCSDFVCSTLHTFAYDMEQSDNGARIEQCKKWCEELK